MLNVRKIYILERIYIFMDNCVCCNKKKPIHAFGKCYHCYRKKYKQPTIICKCCGKSKEHHSRGMCSNCVQKKFYYDKIKRFNIKQYHNISLELWKEVTKKCIICGFDKIVDLHHLDHNKKNNSKDNLIGLCPNHHKMIHDLRFEEEIKDLLDKRLKR